MGKFYLENKHKWFLHLIESSHEKIMRESGGFITAAAVVDELRFFHKDTAPFVPKNLRIQDHGLPQLAVLSVNGYIGDLDDASSEAMRSFLNASSHLKGACPAVLVRHEELTGAYMLRLGVE